MSNYFKSQFLRSKSKINSLILVWLSPFNLCPNLSWALIHLLFLPRDQFLVQKKTIVHCKLNFLSLFSPISFIYVLNPLHVISLQQQTNLFSLHSLCLTSLYHCVPNSESARAECILVLLASSLLISILTSECKSEPSMSQKSSASGYACTSS